MSDDHHPGTIYDDRVVWRTRNALTSWSNARPLCAAATQWFSFSTQCGDRQIVNLPSTFQFARLPFHKTTDRNRENDAQKRPRRNVQITLPLPPPLSLSLSLFLSRASAEWAAGPLNPNIGAPKINSRNARRAEEIWETWCIREA